jgi:ABC-2 type transport system permease protein
MTGSGIATVARQEFRLRIRAGRWKWLLGTFFLILLGFTALLRGALAQVTGEEVAFPGTVVYGGLMLFVLGLALLVVPALAAQSVNGDRERGTLATLQVTRLTPGEITLGKFVAAWGTALVFLALTLPLVAYAMTQKGVPLTRVLVVTLVIALLLGSVCAVSLWWSAVLSRTTTSGVLAYLSVFALTVGTLILFGLFTAVTAETYTETYQNDCPPDAEQFGCVDGPVTYETSRTRTDKTWWLLAPNPFVVLADAAPQLPDTPPEPGVRNSGVRARDLDPLGQIGSAVRDLRRPPFEANAGGAEPGTFPGDSFVEAEPDDEPPPVWPTGLAVNALLGAGALVHTSRRLRTPTRNLPKGQRVA